MPEIRTMIPVSELIQDAARLLSERKRELRMLLARGDGEMAAGVGHSLDEVLAEADELLSKG